MSFGNGLIDLGWQAEKTEMFSLFLCLGVFFLMFQMFAWYTSESLLIFMGRSASNFKSIQPFKKLKRSKRGNSNASGAQNGASAISQWFPIGSLPSLRLG